MTKFEIFEEKIKAKGRMARVAVVNPIIHSALEASVKVAEKGLAKPILIGDKAKIQSLMEKHTDLDYEIVDARSEKEASEKAVELARNNKADAILKGSVSSTVFLRPMLSKETGIVKKGSLVSHISVFSVKHYHKFLILSDVAVNITPDLSEKVKITANAIDLAHYLDIEKPKVAILAAAESVNPKMQSSMDASVISKMGERGVFGEAIVEGPMAMDLAVSKESCEEKNFKSPVGGDADIIITPDINAGNILYKALAKLCKADLAAVLSGTEVPVVLTSRGDTAQVKYDSLLLALMMQ
ncbi:MAG: bifunctional enoyl-CoA hydratase/phosphate acetyltransferase [bacterium]